MTTTLVPVRREASNLWDVASEVDRLFDSPFELLPRMAGREGLWHPTLDVYNRATELMVELELPGIRMEDLDLRIEENHLILEGSRRRTDDHSDGDMLYGERLFGSFHRVIHLPSEVDPERVEARLADGLLVIRLPKIRSASGKKIDIKAA